MRTEPFFLEDARKLARNNSWFRHVIYTGDYSQVALMALPPGEEIGDEMHEGTDQIFLIVEGSGEAILDGRRLPIVRHDLITVRSGTRHNIRNPGREDLKLVTIYSPAAYAEGTIHRTREDAIGAMVSRDTTFS